MTSIQHSLIDTQQISLATPVKQPDNGEGFEAVLNTVVLEETSKPVDLNNLIAENQEDLPTLESDIYAREQAVMSRAAESEQVVQRAIVHLTREHVPKETATGMFTLKKTGLKTVETDGTEVDPSMMIPLIPIDVCPNPITFIIYELKEDGESLQANLTSDDSLEPSINVGGIDAHSINPTYVKVDSKNDVSDAATPVLNDKETLARDITQETTLQLSVSKESILQDHAAELMPTAQSISDMMDKSTIKLRPTSSKMTPKIQSQDDGTLMEDVPIVSITLKRDPVMRDVPLKKSDSDLAPQNESLVLDQIVVPKSKISDGAAQATKETEIETDSFESDFEEVEPLSGSTVKEAVFKPASSTTPTESSEVTADATISKPVPMHQIQQAIFDAKEGMSSKESKTLTVVLNPEELGVVNVELRSDETGKLHAVLSVEKRETLNVLQHDLNQLKTVLKEIGIDESSISLQLSSNNEQGQQKQSEYVAWEEREQILMRSHQKPMNAVTEKATYPERQSSRRLDIKA